MNGELTKLRIVAFEDPKYKQQVKKNGEFKTLINPENYSLGQQIKLNKSQAQGTSSAPIKYSKKKPEDLSFEIYFDRTGVFKGYNDKGTGVAKDISTFKKVVIDHNGKKHKPNYVIISWGTLLFKGSLSRLDISYKLFNPQGAPIRAVAKVSFTGFVEDELRVAKENNSSPDLTHVRTVTEGDTLPLMTHRIYGDSKYYIEVARVNKLTNFRKLKAGTQIFFPPIEKIKPQYP